jgi:hypothetical protein
MDRYEWDITAQQAINPDFPESVKDYLTAPGRTVLGASVDDANHLVIVADFNPIPLLTNYTYTVSSAKDRTAKARDLAFSYRDKVIAQQTVTATETTKALAAAITLIERLARTD